jgi:1-acyl-sn-glycerol-3-phosphate acyltransferase
MGGEVAADSGEVSVGGTGGSEAREPFEPQYLRSLMDRVFGPIIDHYFRPRLIGHRRLPRRGPALLIPNHSGNAFPYDGMVLDGLLWARDGYPPDTKVRTVYEKELATTWWMRPFGIDNFWRRCGGVDLTFDNFDRLLGRGERLIYYPEGVPGIGKGFGRRYQLQRFSTSFALLAARHGAPVHPVSIVNAEWVIPFNYPLGWVDRLVQRLFRVPFLPLPGALLAILFPWAWYLALPARMVYVVGAPLDLRRLCAEEGVDLASPQRERLQRVAERVRQQMQGDLDRHVARYGRSPYQARLLWRQLRRARRRGYPLLRHILPSGWPLAFVRHERDRRRPPAGHRLQALARDWDLIGFYLPLGWPLLALLRRLRPPPYGYRGLTSQERRRREGAYHWRLAERPLPPRKPAAPENHEGRRASAGE